MSTTFAKIISIMALVLFALVQNGKAADDYSIVVELDIAGTSSIDSAFSTNIDGWSVSPSLRCLWKPNSRLAIGVETGYLNAIKFTKDRIDTEFGNTNVKYFMRVVPIMLVCNMNFGSFDFYGATGASVIISNMQVFGKKSKVIDYDNSFKLASSYSYDINRYFGMSCELSCTYIPQIETFIAGAGLKFKFVPFTY